MNEDNPDFELDDDLFAGFDDGPDHWPQLARGVADYYKLLVKLKMPEHVAQAAAIDLQRHFLETAARMAGLID
jgi:hypothetical protein